MPGSRAIQRRTSAYGAIGLNDLDFYAGADNAAIDTNSGHSIGFIVVALPATAASTFLIGDAVFITLAAGLVNKTTTVANYAGRVGIVCGGPDTDYRIIDDYTQVGVTLAKSSTTAVQSLMIAIAGKYWGIADETMAAGGPVGIGAAITTAGRLKTTAPVAGRIFGVKLSLSTEAAGTAFPLLLTLS